MEIKLSFVLYCSVELLSGLHSNKIKANSQSLCLCDSLYLYTHMQTQMAIDSSSWHLLCVMVHSLLFRASVKGLKLTVSDIRLVSPLLFAQPNEWVCGAFRGMNGAETEKKNFTYCFTVYCHSSHHSRWFQLFLAGGDVWQGSLPASLLHVR